VTDFLIRLAGILSFNIIYKKGEKLDFFFFFFFTVTLYTLYDEIVNFYLGQNSKIIKQVFGI
jgi:hypothetical protein